MTLTFPGPPITTGTRLCFQHSAPGKFPTWIQVYIYMRVTRFSYLLCDVCRTHKLSILSTPKTLFQSNHITPIFTLSKWKNQNQSIWLWSMSRKLSAKWGITSCQGARVLKLKTCVSVCMCVCMHMYVCAIWSCFVAQVDPNQDPSALDIWIYLFHFIFKCFFQIFVSPDEFIEDLNIKHRQNCWIMQTRLKAIEREVETISIVIALEW